MIINLSILGMKRSLMTTLLCMLAILWQIMNSFMNHFIFLWIMFHHMMKDLLDMVLQETLRYISVWKWKKSAARNCWISARGTIKLHPFSTSSEWSDACMLKGCNCIIRTIFYGLTIEQFLIQVPSEVKHTCWRGASKIVL